MPLPLLDARSVGPLRKYLDSVGTVFAVFDQQDSGCLSYGVAVGAERWFVKTAVTPGSVRSLKRAQVFHAAVRHPAIIPLRHAFETAAGVPALVYPWSDGELLYHATVPRTVDRRSPGSVMTRFRHLPVADVERAIGEILDAHLVVVASGFVAVDLYDGCLLYDFARARMRLLDLDEYRPGPFVPTEQLSGSMRFMAPEEFGTGSVIDVRTTVFTLGRTIRLLLDAGDDETSWRGSATQLAVVRRATRPDPEQRYADVAALAAAWQPTCGQ